MSAPLTLVIDTARPALQLGLALRDGRTDSVVEDRARGHAEVVMDRIASLLSRNGLAYADLGRVAAVAGPGSFTGLRIGISAARGLGLALDIPVLGLPTLVALSLSQQGAHAVLLDARLDEAYVQHFSAPGVPSEAPRLLALAEGLAQTGLEAPLSGAIDIDRLARFAQSADPTHFPPAPVYIRAADAKPQTKGKVAHR